MRLKRAEKDRGIQRQRIGNGHAGTVMQRDRDAWQSRKWRETPRQYKKGRYTNDLLSHNKLP